MKMRLIVLSCLSMILAATAVNAQDKKYPEPTPMEPGMTEIWTPQPKVIKPSDNDVMITPPSDAIVLFDGKSIDEWKHYNGEPAKWTVEKGVMTVKPGTGDIMTKRNFQDFQLHIEWSAPEKVESSSQGRGNSGIYIMDRYEIQILDSYNNETYNAGHAGSVYKQYPPLVNAMRAPGKWNVYDIIFTAPRFKEDGSLLSHGRVTVLHNGVVIQNNSMILGTTEYIGFPRNVAHGPAPIKLQDHGNTVKFRNIWVREL